MKIFFTALLFTLSLSLFAQEPDILIDQRYNHIIDRMDIKNPSDFTSSKPYNRKDIIKRNQDTINDPLNQPYLTIDNALFTNESDSSLSKRAIFKHFYKTKPDLYSYKSDDFTIAFNPIIDIRSGSKTLLGERTFLSSRGAEIKGSINNKLGFYTLLSDNHGRFMDYISNRYTSTGAISGENFWKQYNTTGYDFFSAKGYINFNITKNIRVKFGQDKNFIGDGYRSLILSDYSGNYTHLKIETKIWKFKYTNIFADMVADYKYGTYGTSGAENYPRKFLAFHHLSFNIRKNLNIGVFESIVSGGDSLGQGAFNINYMNPVIFYRAVESNIGSGGNAILGANGKWNFLEHFSIYGQVVLDEFLLAHIKARDEWWANKYAIQLGAKYIDVVNIEGLDLQLEANRVRPYTYSHTNKRTSYSHFNQGLAHPLGSNFNEILGIVRYQPHSKIFITAKYFNIAQGLDFNGDNYGSNILIPNSTRIKRPGEIGHKQLQGNLTKTQLYHLQISYMIKHNLFTEIELCQRNTSNQLGFSKKESFVSFGVRMNIASRFNEF
jgi:hypothetical protein